VRGRLDAIADDLAIGEDRSDGVAVILEQARDAQVLCDTSGNVGSLVHGVDSWAQLGTAPGQTGARGSIAAGR
jgi:hypothetical protein